MDESTTPIGGSRETLSKPTQGEVIGPIGRLRRRIERGEDHRAVGDAGQVAADMAHLRLPERDFKIGAERNLFAQVPAEE